VENDSQITIVMVGPTACGKRWAEILAYLERNIEELLTKYQATVEEIRLIQTGLIAIGQVINNSPRVNGKGDAWKEIITRAEAERMVLCKHQEGKPLFTAMLRLYAATHWELLDTLQPKTE
jgi:hypothetical protein